MVLVFMQDLIPFSNESSLGKVLGQVNHAPLPVWCHCKSPRDSASSALQQLTPEWLLLSSFAPFLFILHTIDKITSLKTFIFCSLFIAYKIKSKNSFEKCIEKSLKDVTPTSCSDYSSLHCLLLFHVSDLRGKLCSDVHDVPLVRHKSSMCRLHPSSD